MIFLHQAFYDECCQAIIAQAGFKRKEENPSRPRTAAARPTISSAIELPFQRLLHQRLSELHAGRKLEDVHQDGEHHNQGWRESDLLRQR